MRKKIIDISELEQCACFNLRSMAREITNDYNNSLRLKNINSTQIPILAILNIYNQIETTKIAKMLNLEVSTLRRNISILMRKKLIKIVKKDVNGNLLSLTKVGFVRLKETLPAWRKLQKKGKKRIKNYMKVLQSIS